MGHIDKPGDTECLCTTAQVTFAGHAEFLSVYAKLMLILLEIYSKFHLNTRLFYSPASRDGDAVRTKNWFRPKNSHFFHLGALL